MTMLYRKLLQYSMVNVMTRGGKRPNSGPKKSMSSYGEKTSIIRVAVSNFQI